MTVLSDAGAGRMPARGEFDIELRHRCRQCRNKLAASVENPHQAFCGHECRSRFYRTKCVVCEKDKPVGARSDRRLCRRPKCRAEYRQNKHIFTPSYPSTNPCRLSKNKVEKSNTSEGKKGGRAWRQIAGPELTANAFHCAIVGADEAVETSRRINARYWRGAGALIGRTDPPVNLLGGYKFPNAPAVDLGGSVPAHVGNLSIAPAHTTDRSGVHLSIQDDLSIPSFLRRAP